MMAARRVDLFTGEILGKSLRACFCLAARDT
jgi:hypothetical protein